MGISWTFYGYVTPAGGRTVQDWFDGLSQDEQDEVRDTMAYLRVVGIQQWKKPEFYQLGGGLSEIRCKVNELNKILRLYGCFWPRGKALVYSLLLGAEKKKSNPQHDVAEARKRKARLENQLASVHEFHFEENNS